MRRGGRKRDRGWEATWHVAAYLVLLECNLYTHLPAYNFVFERPEPTLAMSKGQQRGMENGGSQRIDYILEPLVNSVIMNQHRFDLEGSKEEMIKNAIINVDGDQRLFRSDIAGNIIRDRR